MFSDVEHSIQCLNITCLKKHFFTISPIANLCSIYFHFFVLFYSKYLWEFSRINWAKLNLWYAVFQNHPTIYFILPVSFTLLRFRIKVSILPVFGGSCLARNLPIFWHKFGATIYNHPFSIHKSQYLVSRLWCLLNWELVVILQGR